ncbi:hypothetical protein FHX15_003822 [Rhizobium sp. BK650]|uniref:hypothetical protein n=1 Tax=Rhizobium sp. BK650 TaxID=2586990 RepID=UPI001618793B|nr:hypothetical protein [Rhizobium sp. BK650]MBB3658575.1 hypothetical protein [Rhizobium sp. BK650]
MKCIYQRRSLPFLTSACIALSMPVASTQALDLDVSANLGGISADVGASTRSSGVNAGVDASVGGASSVNANANAAEGGSGITADADANIGGSSGVNTNVNARALGRSGAGANVDARIGGSGNATGPTLFGANGLNLSLGLGGASGGGTGTGADGTETGGRSAPSAVVERFKEMSVNDRQKMLVRCRDISLSSGYDSGLAGLCALLRSTASR